MWSDEDTVDIIMNNSNRLVYVDFDWLKSPTLWAVAWCFTAYKLSQNNVCLHDFPYNQS